MVNVDYFKISASLVLTVHNSGGPKPQMVSRLPGLTVSPNPATLAAPQISHELLPLYFACAVLTVKPFLSLPDGI